MQGTGNAKTAYQTTVERRAGMRALVFDGEIPVLKPANGNTHSVDFECGKGFFPDSSGICNNGKYLFGHLILPREMWDGF